MILKFVAGPIVPGQPTEIALTGENKLVFGA